MASPILSTLPETTTLSGSDLLYTVTGGISKKITGQRLFNAMDIGGYGSYKIDESINTTIDITGVNLLEVYTPDWEFGGGRTLANLTNPHDGQRIRIHAQVDDLTTIAQNSNFYLEGGQSWIPTGAEREICFYYSAFHTVWYEIYRRYYPGNSGAYNQFNVRDFGATGDGITNDRVAIQATLDQATDGDMVYIPPGEYLVDDFILIQKKVILKGTEGTKLKLSSGGGLLKVIDTDNVRIQNFKLDLNNVANSIGIYHLGGWYIHVSDIWCDKSTTPFSGSGLRIESKNTSSGSHGSFVGYYENCTFNTVGIQGANPMKVTTMTFVNLDASWIIADLADCLTFLQPVIQQSGYSHFKLSTISGLTCIGGDFEGSGILYNLGASCQGIQSINNVTGGFTGSYIVGTPSYRCVFSDISDSTDNYTVFMGDTRPFRVNAHIQVTGGTPDFQVSNSGWAVKHRFGVAYSGDTAHLSANGLVTSTSTINLDDTGQGGAVVTINASGQVKVQVADAGTNPRTLTDVVTFDALGPNFSKPIRIPVSTSEPSGKTNGMIAYAGSGWNPGSGSGFYGYQSGSWVKL